MKFDVLFEEQSMRLDVVFEEDGGQGFDAQFESVQEVSGGIKADPYTGAYEVTPKVEAQVLPTARKLMLEDMRVNGVPIYEVSNLADGETVYIATEVEIYGD